MIDPSKLGDEILNVLAHNRAGSTTAGVAQILELEGAIPSAKGGKRAPYLRVYRTIQRLTEEGLIIQSGKLLFADVDKVRAQRRKTLIEALIQLAQIEAPQKVPYLQAFFYGGPGSSRLVGNAFLQYVRGSGPFPRSVLS